MNRFKSLLTVFAFSLLILGIPSFASAQWRDRDNDDYGRNNGTYGRNNGGYNNSGYNNGNLRSAVKRLKSSSRNFERRLDRELDHSRYNDRNREDRLNQTAEDFKDAADRLDNSFGNGRNMQNSVDEASRVLQLGNQIERALSRTGLNYNLQNDWNSIRQDLQVIRDAYGYNYNNNNRNRRNGTQNYPTNRRTTNNGDWRNRIPFPLPF